MCVHSAIAYADALCIRARGVKSASGDHTDAAELLQGTVPIRSPSDRAAIRNLRAMLQQKDDVSYSARLVRRADAERLLERLEAFAAWAEERYTELT